MPFWLGHGPTPLTSDMYEPVLPVVHEGHYDSWPCLCSRCLCRCHCLCISLCLSGSVSLSLAFTLLSILSFFLLDAGPALRMRSACRVGLSGHQNAST